MIGRQVTVALRRPLHARLCTIAAPQPHLNLAIRTFTHASRLLDGPTGRPRKAVGEPSRPVKRAVKSAAKKPANPEKDAAAKKLAEKQKLAKEKLADKAHAAAAKERELKASEKKKAAAAARKAKITPEQLAKKEAVLLKADSRELKKVALEPPTVKKSNSYNVYVSEKGDDLKALTRALPTDSDGKIEPGVMRATMAQHAKNIAAAWKELAAGDIEHYNHLAHTEKDASLAEYKHWVESHTPEEIKLANAARLKLRRRETSTTPLRNRSKWPAIVDERAPRGRIPSYAFFLTSRMASGDFKNISGPARMKLIGQEWKVLSEEEKSKYRKLGDQDTERYQLEAGKVSESSTASDSDA